MHDRASRGGKFVKLCSTSLVVPPEACELSRFLCKNDETGGPARGGGRDWVRVNAWVARVTGGQVSSQDRLWRCLYSPGVQIFLPFDPVYSLSKSLLY